MLKCWAEKSAVNRGSDTLRTENGAGRMIWDKVVRAESAAAGARQWNGPARSSGLIP